MPEDVAELIRRIEGSRARIVEQAERAVVSNDRGGKVQLTYYRTQEQFDELGRDGGPSASRTRTPARSLCTSS